MKLAFGTLGDEVRSGTLGDWVGSITQGCEWVLGSLLGKFFFLFFFIFLCFEFELASVKCHKSITNICIVYLNEGYASKLTLMRSLQGREGDPRPSPRT